MATPEESGIRAVEEFLESFNAQDHERQARSLNYPHIRLAQGRFTKVDTPAEFVEIFRRDGPRMRASGWDHSEIGDLNVIHAAEDKVHIAIRMQRCDSGGRVYEEFRTLWIATRVDNHWGIQFRSSYVD